MFLALIAAYTPAAPPPTTTNSCSVESVVYQEAKYQSHKTRAKKKKKQHFILNKMRPLFLLVSVIVNTRKLFCLNNAYFSPIPFMELNPFDNSHFVSASISHFGNHGQSPLEELYQTFMCSQSIKDSSGIKPNGKHLNSFQKGCFFMKLCHSADYSFSNYSMFQQI